MDDKPQKIPESIFRSVDLKAAANNSIIFKPMDDKSNAQRVDRENTKMKLLFLQAIACI
jgi:hypothetical protein